MNTICFDLDGTLTDPKIGIVSCIRYALAKLGRPVSEDEDLTWCIGPPLLGSFEHLVGNGEDAEQAVHYYRERFGKIGLYENDVYPGIPDVLKSLKDEGRRLFVATSKPTFYAEQILKHFELSDYFETVFGSELDGTRADKTELLAWVVANAKLDAAQTVMIGDRRHDVIGAKNNGIKAIGVLYGYGDAAELEAAGAFELCESPGDVLGALAARA